MEMLILSVDTGKHRYVFLLYRHGPGTQNISRPSQRQNWGTGRPRHGARQWAKEHDLTLVGMYFPPPLYEAVLRVTSSCKFLSFRELVNSELEIQS